MRGGRLVRRCVLGLSGGGEGAEAELGGGGEAFEVGELLFGVVEAVFELLELVRIACPRFFKIL
jgi:hypothetical protein